MLKIEIGILVVALSLMIQISSPSAAPAKKGTNAPKETRPGSNQDVSTRPSVAGFTISIKDFVKAKTSEVCSAYGGEADCIEEVEICLAMRDADEDVVRVCVNTAPESGRSMQAAHARGR